MKALSYLVSFTMAICGLVSIELPASATAADITGTWEVTFHTPPPDGDLPATFVLKQDGEKISGNYDGPGGPDDVTGTIKGNDVVLTLAKQRRARLSGKVKSATQMSGTMTGARSDGEPIPWSAEKKK
jgi:hypothetical protein